MRGAIRKGRAAYQDSNGSFLALFFGERFPWIIYYRLATHNTAEIDTGLTVDGEPVVVWVLDDGATIVYSIRNPHELHSSNTDQIRSHQSLG